MPISDTFMKELLKMTEVEKHQVYVDTTPLNMKYVFELESKLPERVCKRISYIPYMPKWPVDISENMSMMEQIRQKDRMLFFPLIRWIRL